MNTENVIRNLWEQDELKDLNINIPLLLIVQLFSCNPKGETMEIVIVILLILIIASQSSTYVLKKRQLENQGKIIERLALIEKAINEDKNKDS